MRHLAKHGVTQQEFEDAAGNDPLLVDYQDVDGEDVWTGLGARMGTNKGLRVLTVVFTVRKVRIRAVTAYEANKSDARSYWKERGK